MGPRGLQSFINTPNVSDILATSMVVNIMCPGTFPDTDASWQRMSHAYVGLLCWLPKLGAACKSLIENKQSSGIIWESATCRGPNARCCSSN